MTEQKKNPLRPLTENVPPVRKEEIWNDRSGTFIGDERPRPSEDNFTRSRNDSISEGKKD